MLTRGMTLRAVHAAAVDAPGEPGWMAPFLASLARDDPAPATLRGYHYGNERPRARPAGAPRQPPRTPPATLRAIPLPCTFTRMGLLILAEGEHQQAGQEQAALEPLPDGPSLALPGGRADAPAEHRGPPHAG